MQNSSKTKSLLKQRFMLFLPYFLPFAFFILAISNITAYGMNWDSPVHFARGQAYLRYILTGKSDYIGLPEYCMGRDGNVSRVDNKSGEVCDKSRAVRVSEYESSILTFNWARENDNYGHPPFSDLGLAITNQIFYKWLGWFEDIESYHLFTVFTTFLLASTVAHWLKKTYGAFSAVVSTLTIYLFPLLHAEQHFNVKDPPMAAFFTLGMYFFWIAFTSSNWKFLLFSAFAAGASFATKLNYVFAPFILLPWLSVFLFQSVRKHKQASTFLEFVKNLVTAFSFKFWLSLLLYPVIVFVIFFISWPVLWEDPVANIQTVISYYQGIGVRTCPFDRFTFDWLLQCSDVFALRYLVFTLPLVTIVLFLIGLAVSVRDFRKNNFVTILWISFFLVTILRVTLSIAQIYGGLRQIMEIIAPIGLIAGVGGMYLRDFIVRFLRAVPLLQLSQRASILLASAFVLLCFLPIMLKLILLHPNQNLYFNPLVGGIRGAYEKEIPGVGNTYGSVYFQAVSWLNQNAEQHAKIALLSGLAQNLSRGSLRGDFLYGNYYLSSYNHKGEYLILPIMKGDPVVNTFRYKFFDAFMEPVHELRVEGVPILKIWKNDSSYIKPGVDLLSEEAIEKEPVVEGDSHIIALDSERRLKRLEILFNDHSCQNLHEYAQIAISSDKESYHVLQDALNDFTEHEVDGFTAGYVYFFAGDLAEYVKISPIDSACRMDIRYNLYVFL